MRYLNMPDRRRQTSVLHAARLVERGGKFPRIPYVLFRIENPFPATVAFRLARIMDIHCLEYPTRLGLQDHCPVARVQRLFYAVRHVKYRHVAKVAVEQIQQHVLDFPFHADVQSASRRNSKPSTRRKTLRLSSDSMRSQNPYRF